MARFPKSEAEILALAQELVTGLSANVAVYPSPPVSVMDLATTISYYISAKNAAIAAQAAAEQATSDKEDALEDLTETMKAEIHYAENTVNYDDDKLKLIGRAGRATRMIKSVLLFVLFSLGMLVLAQDAEIDDDPPVPEFGGVQPPPDIRNWTPDQQFQLYVNFDGATGDTFPRIDILSDKDESWPFWMEHIGETLYVFIIPPGYAMNEGMAIRNRVDSLDDEFPFVVWAGTQRVLYWFSYSKGEVTIDTTLDQATFIEMLPLQELPGDILTLQLKGKNKNAKIIRSLLKKLDDHAKLVQLEEGFYHGVWFKIKKTIVQNFKTNETKTGTFLALRCHPGSRDVVSEILEKYRCGEHADAH